MRQNKVFNRYKRMGRKLPCRICGDLDTDRIDPAVDLERGVISDIHTFHLNTYKVLLIPLARSLRMKENQPSWYRQKGEK